MYPSPVVFVEVPVGAGGVALRWATPDDFEPHHFAVFRSETAIPAEQTEAFYEGRVLGVTRVVLPATARGHIDPLPGQSAWILVLGGDASGNLHAVPFDVAPVRESTVYDEAPALVFRQDDPAARATVEASARALGPPTK